MRVFLTGATGFIGSRIVPELFDAGHQVLGLTRSDVGAAALTKRGAEAHLGSLENPESLARGAALADAVIHTAFDHDFANFVANCEKDRRAIEAMGGVLAGSDRPLIMTSGVGMGSAEPGRPATEDVFDPHHPNPRVLSEVTGAKMLESEVSVAVVRLPQVHDIVKQGLISPLVELAREKRVSAYVGDGAARWSAAHVSDVARLFRLALDRHASGARWHAVAEEGIAMREIAEAVGAGLGVPVVSLSPDAATDHFGPFAMFVGLDMTASSKLTREKLDWQPTGPGLIEDLHQMDYAPAAPH